jgi:poly(hydroxyalkanoate) depolymerase family esterase
MRPLSDTIARLKGFPPGALGEPANTRLRPFDHLRPNPGQLKAWVYVPESSSPGAAMVVVLHGCTQTAAGYDHSSGWSRLADRHGFLLLYPEQQRTNNPNLCFNWFSADDTARGKGEARSIREMVAAVQDRYRTDPHRVFVTGLSAGGAMTAVMLATYPDVFAGGAVIAGLPYGVAHSVPQAFDRMRGHGLPEPAALAAIVRSASTHSADWPILSVWHGSADQTVDRSNASALVDQWREVHGARSTGKTDTVYGYPHTTWSNPNGRVVIEDYSITGLGHGTPLDTRDDRQDERAAPFMLEAGISSTRLIAQFWGIVPEQAKGVPIAPSVTPDVGAVCREPPQSPSWSSQGSLEKTIEDALRRAGLM